ncbi:MAG: hypothetical protein ACO3ST_00195 [Burkholderiaceae bacterium]
MIVNTRLACRAWVVVSALARATFTPITHLTRVAVAIGKTSLTRFDALIAHAAHVAQAFSQGVFITVGVDRATAIAWLTDTKPAANCAVLAIS